MELSVWSCLAQELGFEGLHMYIQGGNIGAARPATFNRYTYREAF